MSSILGIAGIIVDVLAVLILFGLVGLFVIVVVANRADPDPTGRRPQSVYFFAISFVTITVSIMSSAVVVSAIVRLFFRHSGSIRDSVARTVVLGGLIALVSGFLFITHLRRGLDLARADDQASSPSRRVGQSYVSAVAFLAVLSLLVLSVLAVYLLFSLGGPGVFGSFGGRDSALQILIETIYLGGVAAVVLVTHRDLLSPGLHLFGRYTDSTPAEPVSEDPSLLT